LAIRNELGQSFFDATAAWQRKPNTNNEEERHRRLISDPPLPICK